MKKKLISLMLAGTMALSLAACGGNAPAETTAAETKAEETAAAEESKEEAAEET